MRNLFACCGFALALVCSPESATGAVVVTLSVVGDSVIAEGSGSLNLDALTFDSNEPLGGAFLDPSLGAINVGPAGPGGISIYTGISSDPGPFGGGGSGDAGSPSGSGDLFGIGQGALTELIVPEGYVSGSPLSGKTTWSSVNLGNLDLTPGTYVWTWGTGSTADSFTLKVVTTTAPIPEPGTLGLFTLTGVGLMVFRRRVRS